MTNPTYVAPSNEIADFRLLWNDAENRYTIIGFVKNAFDEVGYGRVTPSSPTLAPTPGGVAPGSVG